jgi:trimeric autotransporter adhesin
MACKSGKRAGVKISIVLLSVFLFLLLFAPVAFAATYGDINDDGDVDVLDVVLVMKHVLDLDGLTTAQEAVADVNGDGNINVQDVTLIMQYSLGLIDEFPHAALAVTKVTAVNPKQVEVEFNRMLNAEEKTKMVTANFHVGLQAAPATNVLTGAGSAVAVLSDSKTVLLTMANGSNFVNGSATNRVVVKKAVGIAADYVNASLAFVDTSVPTLVSVETISPREIVMTFSEPLDRTIVPTNITLNAGAIALNLAGKVYVDARRELIVETFSDLTAGSYTLAITSGTSLKDYSGFSVAPTSKVFTHTPVTTAPTVSVKSATESSVTLEFSRAINPTTLVNNASVLFRHTYDTLINQVTGTDVTNPSGDSRTFVVDFDTRLLPPGSTTVWMKYADGTIDANKIKDTWGNIIPPATFTANVVPDTVAPTATVTVFSNTQIDVQYSKDVNGATTIGNYSLKQGSTTVDISGIDNLSGYKYRLTTATAMQGAYTLTISNIKDKSPAENPMGTKVFDVNVPDTIKPFITEEDGVTPGTDYYKQAISPNPTTKVRIYFSEAMNATDLANKAMYENGAANPTVATPAADNKSVYLEFAVNVSGNLTVGPLKDVAGNSLGLATVLTGVYATPVGLDSTVTDPVLAITTTTIRLYLSEIVIAESYEDYEISDDNGITWLVEPQGISNSTSSGKSVITLYLDSADAMPYNADDVKIRTVASPSAKNLYNMSLDIAASDVEDRIAPVVITAKVNSVNEIELTFSEDLDSATFAAAGLNGFSVSGSTILKAVTKVGDDTKVVITMLGGNFVAGSSTVSYTAGIVADLEGNKLLSFSNKATE